MSVQNVLLNEKYLMHVTYGTFRETYGRHIPVYIMTAAQHAEEARAAGSSGSY
ncbi:MAG: hypothetical protein QM802_20825 [Agriterribacter sp.]